MYKHILLATALDDEGLLVEMKARELADCHNAKLSIVHTVEPIPAYGYPDLEALQSPFIDKAREKMQVLADKLKIPAADQHIEFGPVKNIILKLAETLGVDCIVIGSHGRHGFSRLLGSGAARVIHGANCDVLIVRCECKV